MKLRQMATAFVCRDGKIAMMKKSKNQFFDFEFWTALGGHMEADEINDPAKACLREVYDESGLEPKDIAEFKLRYILLRQKESEIRIQYVYFGKTEKAELISSDEGDLFWVDEADIPELAISAIIREMLRHYSRNRQSETVFVGAMTRTEREGALVQWSEMRDPFIF